jgi:hypothetical protein
VDWDFNQHRVTIRQLLLAAENHLFLGGPWRMYLMLDDAAAGGGGIDYWLEVVRSLSYVEAFLVAHGLTTATLDTARAFAALVRRLSRTG